MNKKETILHWKRKIANDPRWAIRAAVRIYEAQTEDEKHYGVTTEPNGVGFNSFDAPVITQLVLRIKRKEPLNKGAQLLLMRRMPKYAGQLYKITKS